MNAADIFVEVECSQWIKNGQNVCGDAFESARIKNENRLIATLADGLGSGVKANILATMTATMAQRFSAANRDIVKFSRIMRDSLPICQVRKISYSTFTIVDCIIEETARIVEQGNPPYLLIRNGMAVPVEREKIGGESEARAMFASSFSPVCGDRIIICSDGVSQAGIGSKSYAFGWQIEGCQEYVLNLLKQEPEISARELALMVRNEALAKWPQRVAKDDISCAVIYFRKPRKALVLSGPPFDKVRDKEYADLLRLHRGSSIVCGGTTAQIIARELGEKPEIIMSSAGNDLPPASKMPSASLVTEGILTLTRAVQYLEKGRYSTGDPAASMVDMLLENDEIKFVVGTKVNEAHQDPTLPVDLEMRRNIVKRICRVLEKKYLKVVTVEFI